MSQDFANVVEVEPGRSSMARERVSKIVESDLVQPCSCSDSLPHFLKAHKRFSGSSAGAYVGVAVGLLNSLQDLQCGLAEWNRLLAGLAIGEKGEASVKIEIAPSEVENLTLSHAG